MKKLFAIIVSILILNNGYTQNIETHYDSRYFKIDFTKPESGANGLIQGFNNSDFDLIQLVIDQLVYKNQIAKKEELIDIRDRLLKNDYLIKQDIKKQSDEKQMYIDGPATYSNIEKYEYSYVTIFSKDIKFGYKRKFILTLINRYGNWFLISIYSEKDYLK